MASGNGLKLASNLEALTPNGKHLYYRWTEVTKNAVKILPGIDIRADGGYVVAPPSILEDNRAYKWRNYSLELPLWSSGLLNGSSESDSSRIITGGEMTPLRQSQENGEEKDLNLM
jgi:hypothetical protein